MTPKQLQAQTERNLKTLLSVAEKTATAIADRFSDVDNCIARDVDELPRMIEQWVEEKREYMRQCITDKLWGE